MAEWTFPVFGHGGDYNPDQWLHIPGTLEEDIRLMKLSHVNLVSVGIFSWAALEPEEGKYDFDWLEHVLDTLHENGISALLATPSGARPVWMAQKYPEVLRVSANRVRNLQGGRHNHCYTTPVYREFVRRMNVALAEKFGHHPAVVGWHISNEYLGECHCECCQEAFRSFLKEKYLTLKALNEAYWTGFWAKKYTDWNQIVSPSPRGETGIHGLNLDWKRFVTRQTVDFMRQEIQPIRRLCPDKPVTTNFHGGHMLEDLDYFKFQDVLDISSFDAYPAWGSGDDDKTALETSFNYDCTRSILRKPWLLMESTPSMTNWQEVCKLKRPGMHLLSSMQAVAHGADSVQYFQWRKSRGSSEKFHGAVVDHVGHEHTRVFRDVAQVGEYLEKLKPLVGSRVPAQAAVIYDWNNRWAVKDAQGPRRDKQYEVTVLEHYAALRRAGVDVDVIDEEQSLEPYKIVAAPMMYLVKPGVAEKLEKFVSGGGVLLMTYWSGIVDENDLCFLGGFPGPLKKLAGIWSEEIDSLYPDEHNSICMGEGNELEIEGEYECGFLLDLIHPETARVQAVYGSDFYKGMPALTVNDFGKGKAWYLTARPEERFLQALYARLVRQAGLKPILDSLPAGVQVTSRVKEGQLYRFIMNFGDNAAQVKVPASQDAISGEQVLGEIELLPKQIRILKQM